MEASDGLGVMLTVSRVGGAKAVLSLVLRSPQVSLARDGATHPRLSLPSVGKHAE